MRELQKKMDHEVVACYGWFDINLTHGFVEGKQGMRYSFLKPFCDQILESLLNLNLSKSAESSKIKVSKIKGISGKDNEKLLGQQNLGF
jgi:hypothetical protein